jgi:hypothetical protein
MAESDNVGDGGLLDQHFKTRLRDLGAGCSYDLPHD